MELPQFVVQSSNADEHVNHQVNNSVLNNLIQLMNNIKLTYDAFMSLHAQIFASQHPDYNLTIFTARAHLQKNPNIITFVTGFMGIMSIAGDIDLTNPHIVLQHKAKIFQLITNCEKHFFSFNEQYPATPEMQQLICQISMLFTAVKQELKKLGLFDVPSYQFNANSNPNSLLPGRAREDIEGSVESRSHIRRRKEEPVPNAEGDDQKQRAFTRKP